MSISRVDQADVGFQSILNVKEPWAIVCDAHGTVIGCGSLDLARDRATDLNDWCEQCTRGAVK